MLKLPVYLDYQATTPTDPRVLDAMLPYFREQFGNPHSVHHSYGWNAEKAVEKARARTASLIGARPEEIVFTSGATEANNLAILGAAQFNFPDKKHVVTCATEHTCVLEAAGKLERDGFRITILGVDSTGLIDITELESALCDDTALVSIMAVNNEIGVIQPIEKIGALCASRGVLLHSDAAQAAGKIPLDVDGMHIDLMSISGHKTYGPMGIGALYVRHRPRVRLKPIIHGGGQERGLRSGTLPTPLCVGLGAACHLAGSEMSTEANRIQSLRDALLAGLGERVADLQVNGDLTHRVPGNLNMSFPGVDAEELIIEAKDLAISTASACTTATLRPSHVVQALGIPEELAHASVRIGIGRFTTREEIDFAIDRITAAVERLRTG